MTIFNTMNASVVGSEDLIALLQSTPAAVSVETSICPKMSVDKPEKKLPSRPIGQAQPLC
jgi:hypothetical protein